MRALIISISTLFLFTNYARPEAATVGLMMSQENSEGSTLIDSQDSPNRATGSLQTMQMNFSSGLRKNFYRVRGNLTQVNQDLTNYVVKDKSGRELSLGEEFDGKETQLALGGDIQWDNWTFSLDGKKTVSKSPLSQKSYQVGVGHNFYKYGNTVTLTFGQATYNRPLSYGVNPETRRQEKSPTSLHVDKMALSIDQIISERVKTSVEVFGIRKIEDRPDALGGKFSVLFAPTDLISLYGSYQDVKERRGELPQDGRGYFSLRAYELGVAFEPLIGTIIKIQGTTVVEKESARGTNPSQLVGTDAIGVKVINRFKRLLVEASFNATESNTQYQSINFSGGITWEI